MTSLHAEIIILLLLAWECISLLIKSQCRKRVRACEEKIIKLVSKLLGEENRQSKITPNIKGLIDRLYRGQFIEVRRQKVFKLQLEPLVSEAKPLVKYNYGHKSKVIRNFLYEYNRIDLFFKDHNTSYIEKCLQDNSQFFDTILKYPLDQQQRRSIVAEEDNVLVASSAGSGTVRKKATKTWVVQIVIHRNRPCTWFCGHLL